MFGVTDKTRQNRTNKKKTHRPGFPSFYFTFTLFIVVTFHHFLGLFLGFRPTSTTLSCMPFSKFTDILFSVFQWVAFRWLHTHYHLPISWANSLFARIALACSMLKRPFIPSSDKTFRIYKICFDAVSQSFSSLVHTFLIPQANTSACQWVTT